MRSKIVKILVVIIGLIFLGGILQLSLYSRSENESLRIRQLHYDLYNSKIGSHSEDVSVIVDFSIPSSASRMFVYDRRIAGGYQISSSKCAHGAGGGSTISKPVFSNVAGSECSSLGSYRLVRNDKMTNTGLPCIRLEGLDASNSNAASRGIVIHEGPVLADDISLGFPIPVTRYISQGCFTISSRTFHCLQQLVENGSTVYLYAIYEDGK